MGAGYGSLEGGAPPASGSQTPREMLEKTPGKDKSAARASRGGQGALSGGAATAPVPRGAGAMRRHQLHGRWEAGEGHPGGGGGNPPRAGRFEQLVVARRWLRGPFPSQPGR